MCLNHLKVIAVEEVLRSFIFDLKSKMFAEKIKSVLPKTSDIMDRPPIKTQEHDIDYLVIEEVYSNESFRKWLLEQFEQSRSHELIGAWRSTVTKNGETDIAIGLEIKDEKHIFLIENKIYAPEQPNQPDRYHQRGEERVEKGEWDEYHTGLLSPSKYLENYKDHSYEVEISYEQLLDYFNKKSDSRSSFQKQVIQEGIEKARKGYQRTTDEITDDFYKYYEELSRSQHPELEYRKPEEVASGNSWIRFPNPLPKNSTIIHKSGRGYVDLQISDFDGDSLEFKHKYGDSLEDMTVTDTGKSISVRIHVPKLKEPDRITTPSKYEEEISEALNSASKLLTWYTENYHKT